jgi:biotin carboxylase
MTLGAEVSPTVSAIAQEFSLTSVSPDVAHRTTNKCARSERLREAAIPMPRFTTVHTAQLPDLPLPFVIKPSDNSGSRGVRIVCSEEEWPAAYDQALAYSGDGLVIVEEFLRGEEVSIEGFVLDGEMMVTGFSDRNYLRDDKYYPYFVEDGSSSPTNLPADVVTEAEEVFSHAARALGIHAGPSKGDLIVTDEGVKVLEITSRLSPGFSIVCPFTSGVDPLEATIRWATGMEIPPSILSPRFQRAMAHRYYMHQPGRIVGIQGLEQLSQRPGIKTVVILRPFSIGDVLEPAVYINRLLYVYAVADERSEAERLAADALSSLRVVVE